MCVRLNHCHYSSPKVHFIVLLIKINLPEHHRNNSFKFVGNTKLEVVDEYVHLGQIVRLGKSNFDREVNRRIQLGWAAFGKLRHIFSSGILQNLKTRLYTQCVLPVMTWN
ncbi:unnamed protein product [Parnassius mnemosyne]|uniref:Uncharacterized protein n=1 Tax=Parnassius mnemosyne TaxID=213953 RepID=A0AAV1M0S3_9NEOP